MATVRLLNKQNREASTLVTASVDVPVGFVGKLGYQALMDAGDLADGTLTVRFAVFGTWDPQGLVWLPLFGGVHRGGVDGEGNPVGVPNQSWQTTGPQPLRIRVEVDWNKRCNLGLDVSVG